MKIFHYVTYIKTTLALVAALLIVQAIADLALPAYTAKLVDVGIAQYGMEYAIPEILSEETYEACRNNLDGTNRVLLENAYTAQEDGTYIKNVLSPEHTKELDAVLVQVLAHLAQSYDFSKNPNTSSDTSDVAHVGPTAHVYAQAQKAMTVHEVFDDENDIQANETSRDMRGNWKAEEESQTLEDTDSEDEVAGEDDELPEIETLDKETYTLKKAVAMHLIKEEYDRLHFDTAKMQMGYVLSTGMRMFFITLVMAASAALSTFVLARAGAGVAKTTRQKIFDAVTKFSETELHEFTAGSLITRATNDVQQIQQLVQMGVRMVLYTPIVAIGAIVMVFRTAPSMSWVIVVGVIAIAVVVGALFALTMPKFKKLQALIDKVNNKAREILDGMLVIRAFGQEYNETLRFQETNEALMKTQRFAMRALAGAMPLIQLIMNGMNILIIWVGAHMVGAGNIQVGQVIAFITYAMIIMMSFMFLGMMAAIVPRAEISAKRIDEILTAIPAVQDPTYPRALNDKTYAGDMLNISNKYAQTDLTERVNGVEIEFNDVTLEYKSGNGPVLSHVSFTVPAGTTCALVGATGSGKSSILKLLLRFVNPTKGSISIDGINIADIRQEELRKQFGYVPQVGFLFSGTISENIAYGTNLTDDAIIHEAARIAQADSFIESLEDGYDTVITQGGKNISGGQRQRLAIARAIAAHPRAFLFDDSFSALDFSTDAQLRQALAQHYYGATVLIVAQRISSVIQADSIIVLDEGAIVGMGTHDELLATCDVYRDIATSQLSVEELTSAADYIKKRQGGATHE